MLGHQCCSSLGSDGLLEAYAAAAVLSAWLCSQTQTSISVLMVALG